MNARLSSSLVPTSRVAAFFDLDKTIIATSSAFAFGREFLNNGLITPTEALQLSLAKASYMVVGQTSQQMDATRDQLTEMIKGWSVSDVQEIATETMNSVVTPAIYSEARELIKYHKAAGHAVIIISASAAPLVELIAKELGVEDIVATELEVVDGKFTGEILNYCKGPEKAKAMQQIAAEQGINLDASFAYSDSATDIPMLQLVGNPVAVNPDRGLRKHAVDNNWDIRAFKNPVPLFTMPGAKEVGIGASVVAGIAACVAGAVWLLQQPEVLKQLGLSHPPRSRRR